MANGYTIFTTYILVPNNGQSKSIHCNYIKSQYLDTGNPYIQEISINFDNINDFRFLNDDISNNTGGYTAHKIYAIVQIVNNSGFTTLADVKSNPSKWKVYDLTTQITGHVSGATLTALELTSQTFKVPLLNYNSFSPYLIDYLNYPTKEISANNELCFGDEEIFFGNVSTQIKSIAYTTNISIVLPLNEFNSSTNATWDGNSVFISEIGIYDANKNLVGIGKLNNPIEKNSTISSTIQFAIDF